MFWKEELQYSISSLDHLSQKLTSGLTFWTRLLIKALQMSEKNISVFQKVFGHHSLSKMPLLKHTDIFVSLRRQSDPKLSNTASL